MAKRPVKRKFYPSELLNLKGSWLVSMQPVWQIPSSAGDSHYEVAVFDQGFTCECMGFTRWGHCKHIRGLEEKLAELIN